MANDELEMDGHSTPPPDVAKRDPEFLARGEIYAERLKVMSRENPVMFAIISQCPFSRYVEAVLREVGRGYE